MSVIPEDAEKSHQGQDEDAEEDGGDGAWVHHGGRLQARLDKGSVVSPHWFTHAG